MKTTILTSTPVPNSHPASESIPIRILHLILIANYLLVLILLLSVQQRHRYAGGMAIPQSSLVVLFVVLIMLHGAMMFRHRIPGQIGHYGGISLAIISTMTLSLILFSRQSVNLYQTVYPGPELISTALVISLLLGVYLVKKEVTAGNQYLPLVNSEKNLSITLPENRYMHARILAEGGVGSIWYAERITDGVPVVVKVPIHNDEQTGMSFLQEISIWKELNHPNIVPVFSVNVLPVPYMEMEYLPGSLATLEKPVPVTQALQLITELVSALMYAHERGIVHCDIKPTNILLTSDGVPKLTDWGLSRSGSSRWAVSGYSPRYAAPEQSRSTAECTPATDIWQIGMVLSELITGKAKIPSGTEPVFLQPGGDVTLAIIHRCLASDPNERYQSAQALHEDLDLKNT